MPRRKRHRKHSARIKARVRRFEPLESRLALSAAGAIAAVADQSPAAESETPATFESFEALRDWIAQAATERYGDLFGSTQDAPTYGWWSGGRWSGGIEDAVVRTFDIGATTNFALDSTSGHSGTNVQVAGVDEADLVETDGESLFVVSGDRLSIIDVRDPSDLSLLAEVELDRQVVGIYLSGDRLTLVSGGSGGVSSGLQRNVATWEPPVNETTVTVLDVGDPTSPQVIERVEVDGHLVESRMVDGLLTLVTERSPTAWLPAPRSEFIPDESLEPSPEGSSETGELLIREPVGGLIAAEPVFVTTALWTPPKSGVRVYESLDEYVDRVAESLVAGWRTLGADGEVIDSGELVAATDLAVPTDAYPRTSHRTFVTTFDTADYEAGPEDTLVLATTDAAVIYATGEHLYVFGQAPQTAWNAGGWQIGGG
ncbi:MAG: beta-propeller domain-containing protein, partial [Planctomycetota bacterium]